jgi:cytochrome c5
MKVKKIFSDRNSLKLGFLVLACLAVGGFAVLKRPVLAARNEADGATDPEKARAAFLDASKVFFSARCANCHPAADAPTQGDKMTPHTQGVTRGKDGKGVYGMKCTTCHQNENLPGVHLPPGTSKDWHMPPAEQKMVFQGLTPGELCRNFKDPAKNGGHKTLREAMDHVQKKDPLVMWGWNPGNGRTLPPMSFDEFSAKIEEWVASGGPCPE